MRNYVKIWFSWVTLVGWPQPLYMWDYFETEDEAWDAVHSVYQPQFTDPGYGFGVTPIWVLLDRFTVTQLIQFTRGLSPLEWAAFTTDKSSRGKYIASLESPRKNWSLGE